MRTRFAPTPSGYLHLGNAAHAVLLDRWARSAGGTVVLRIDDADTARVRPAYVADIFDLISWLGLRMDAGPDSPAALAAEWSQDRHREEYRTVAEGLLRDGGAFACTCTRTSGPCTCRLDRVAWTPGRSSIRLDCPEHGDPVLWRRDDCPAYHLTSVVDDARLGITHVLRGEDLRASTELQQVLADRIGLPFPGTVLHHPLVTTPEGAKLSKSTGRAGPLPRDAATREAVHALAESWAKSLGIPVPP